MMQIESASKPALVDIGPQYLYAENYHQTAGFRHIGWRDILTMVENPPKAPASTDIRAIKATLSCICCHDSEAKTAQSAAAHDHFTLLCCDVDTGDLPLDGITSKLNALSLSAWCVFSTISHQTPDHGNRWRIFIPISTGIQAERWITLQEYLVSAFGGDPCTVKVSQPAFLPVIGQGDYQHAVMDSAPLDPLDTKHPFVMRAINAQQQRDQLEAKQARTATPAPTKSIALQQGQMSPVAAFNQASSVDELLRQYGYRRIGRKWLHPNSGSGVPGVVVLDGRYYSHHSRETDALADGHTHDAFDLYVEHEHQGDFSHALRAAGDTLLTMDGISISRHNRREYMQGQESGGSSTEPPPALEPEWPAVVPLDTPQLPQLDLNHIPGWAGRFAQALAQASETPPELAAGMVMAACATAMARRCRVMVRPGWIEPGNLWLVVALPPGNRKSFVQKEATRPLFEWEREQRRAMEDEIKRAVSECKSQDARIKELRSTAAKEKSDEKAKQMFADIAAMEMALEEIPRPPRLWTSDVTPEHLGTMLGDNGECMAWLSSEGGIFDLLGGRYSKGIPNLDLILKSRSGDSERVDRGSRPPVDLEYPLTTIGLSPQPDVLRGLVKKPGFRGRGLIARFLYFLPQSPIDCRSNDAEPIRQEACDDYRRGLHAMLGWPAAVNELGE